MIFQIRLSFVSSFCCALLLSIKRYSILYFYTRNSCTIYVLSKIKLYVCMCFRPIMWSLFPWLVGGDRGKSNFILQACTLYRRYLIAEDNIWLVIIIYYQVYKEKSLVLYPNLQSACDVKTIKSGLFRFMY